MSTLNNIGSKLAHAPSFVWIFLLVGGVIGIIGGTIGLFFLLANVEGAASLALLISGWFMAGILASDDFKLPGTQFWIGAMITFYALMGMAIDQPGNFFLNKPLEYFCPAGTSIGRGVVISHPLPGRTDITQDFTCLSPDGKVVDRPSLGTIIGVRFMEYVVIAYALMGIRKLLNRNRRNSPSLIPHS